MEGNRSLFMTSGVEVRGAGMDADNDISRIEDFRLGKD